MYRIKIMSEHAANTYRWYNDLRTACLVAKAIISNKDADRVEIENLKTKRVEIIYK